jgi:hypothetical protein
MAAVSSHGINGERERGEEERNWGGFRLETSGRAWGGSGARRRARGGSAA